MKVLEIAIVDYYNTNMYAGYKPKLYNTEADEKESLPYITFEQISGRTENALRKKKRENFLYQFNIYSNENSVNEVNEIFKYLKEIFDDCELVITGYNFIDMDRDFSKKAKVELNNQSVWQYVVQYRIMIND